jgi:CheY-like chemotaxis protein
VAFSVGGEITGEDTDTITLNITVEDTGRGIRKDDVSKLFREFVQLDMESNKGIEGTGLGLAITYSLIKAMDGDIIVDSEYGKGSTFVITLPQKFNSPEKLAQIENPGEKRVIVYERREIYAKSIAESMENFGLDCTLVASDTELYKKLSRDTCDFIFISFPLLERNKDTIEKFGKSAKTVVLADFGESVPDRALSVLAMPVHAISIANILNGITQSFTYRNSDETIVKFTAPEARVLIVDDVSTNLKVASGLLSPYKMQIDLCRSGAQAIEMVTASNSNSGKPEDRYDLVFMDHMMPEMDGEEATLRIRKLQGEYYQNLPVIALTANAVSDAVEIMSSTFDDFLLKPIDTVKMNSILEQWIPQEKQKKIVYRNIIFDNANTGDAQITERAELAELTKLTESIESTESTGLNQSKELKELKEAGQIQQIEIPGINTVKGIAMTGGNLENYLQTLAIFYKDGQEKISEITKCLEAGNMRDYTIYVHALKSASASIGAAEISASAKLLEEAGNQGDSDFINTHNHKFLSDLETLLNNINAALLSANTGMKTTEITENLKAELYKLKNAVDIFDSSAMDKAVKIIRKEYSGEVIEEIMQNILIGAYEEAILLIDSVLEQ